MTKRKHAETGSSDGVIDIIGARQHNLKNLSLRIPTGTLTVVTGVSGSGKSSLAFDTLYAEGQRRYVETFSPYARQFLDRMDKPQVDRILGIPPAIAIDQTNPVRTSRSTVGTMTEIQDHLKLLFARAATLYCRACGQPVRRDTPQSILEQLVARPEFAGRDALITFTVSRSARVGKKELHDWLEQQGYTRTLDGAADSVEVIQDRIPLDSRRRTRWIEALEIALRHGRGRVAIRFPGADGQPDAPVYFSEGLHCAACDIAYREPLPNHFSFNSPLGACETCKGFGRVISVDYGLVIPDESKTLEGGAIRPWQSGISRECQEDMMKAAKRAGIPTRVPWCDLTGEQRDWVIQGVGSWDDGHWYGVRRFFEWLEKKSYKMHIRVLLSKYRAYQLCPACQGARLKPDSLLWRIGPNGGLNVHQLALFPIEETCRFFDTLSPASDDKAVEQITKEIRTRLEYLREVGLGYLSLDRQSRTLSGGEVQRINLTTALGASLVNTLFVLDEPSIGLHSRDIGRLVGILRRLRDAGNTLLVVEHDPEVIRAADRVLELGPGPGAAGGEIVYHGDLKTFLNTPGPISAEYLSGRRKPGTTDPALRPSVRDATPRLEILGASANNLKNADIRIPLGRLVCLSGVSGSGKSTLVEAILHPALLRRFGRPTEPPGAFRELRGADALRDVVLVDQSPLGKTSRSIPASVMGAFDEIRNLFAKEPLARQRRYTPGVFSFNSGSGRCPTCSGAGFERVEMQFLSDVFLRCPDCDGRRYRAETLEVRMAGATQGQTASISDVLEMTVAEAVAFFRDHPDILKTLEPLSAVGLDYLRLGQPVPTLSGGEAQRLKLAAHLAGAAGSTAGPCLFLFDEPTTGLHPADIEVLLRAFRRLIAAGHSLLVIEHQLDVLREADWIIDLGPEGGDAGGKIVAEGTPAQIAACPHSHTGAALRAAAGAPAPTSRNTRADARPARREIQIHGAREHNLHNISATLPRDQFTVITGVSGSGKSTLAFDILFAEGQRRYLESLNAYARQFVQPATRADVDSVTGIPPTVAIEQRTSRGGRKSTVATATEIQHFLRLLFVKLGVQHCPDCALPIEAQTESVLLARIADRFRNRTIHLLAPSVIARKGIYKELAERCAKKGIRRLRVDGAWIPTSPWPKLDRFREHTIDIPVATLKVRAGTQKELRDAVAQALATGNGCCRVLVEEGKCEATFFSTRRACPRCERSFPELDPRLFSYNSKHGWCPACFGTGQQIQGFDEEQTGEEIWWNAWWDGEDIPCPACHGKRLRPEALAVRFRDWTLPDITAWPIERAEREFRALKLDGRDGAIARDLLVEIRARLGFLKEVGLSYLSLDRSAPTLSGGEAQRIRLAAQLGSNLRGVCYILDEPTIGLHPRDNRMLLDTLRGLRDRGNTIVVVEHDEETIREADYILDLGPQAGTGGGRVVAAGDFKALLAARQSITARHLNHPSSHPARGERRPVKRSDPVLRIRGARLHNLRNVEVRIPLGRLVCVTGVSGSGKSTLVRQILHPNLRAVLAARGRRMKWVGCEQILGTDTLRRVLEVDQTPIGKTPRSCPATYIGFWDNIRRLYAEVPDARVRGYSASRFSFNVKGGRCEVCEGQGSQRIEMSFLPDVSTPCEACGGRRFTVETCSILWNGKSIADVLAMSVDEAAVLFAAQPAIRRPLDLLRDVGLGYLTLGQQSPTLSGGEAQRIKLVTELAKARDPSRRPDADTALYLLDEPTVGLHMADVEKLILALHRLVDAGNSVVLIEHNLDIMAEADWIIDLGPEGGDGGGRVVAEGPPETVARAHGTHTAKWLAPMLGRRGSAGL